MATIGQQVRNGVAATGLLVVLVVVAGVCGRGANELATLPRAQPPTRSAPTIESPSVAHITTPAEDMRLPPRGIDIPKMILRSRADIDGVLAAHGQKRPDGKWSYDRGSDGNVLEQLIIGFDDRGRAVSFEVPGAHSGWRDYDAAHRDAFAKWLGIGPGGVEVVNGKQVEYGDSDGGVGLALYDEEWEGALQKRIDAETKSRLVSQTKEAETARKVVAVRLTKAFRENGADVGFTVDGTTMYVTNLEGGTCDVAGLRAFLSIDGMTEGMKDAGFTGLQCSPHGDHVTIP